MWPHKYVTQGKCCMSNSFFIRFFHCAELTIWKGFFASANTFIVKQKWVLGHQLYFQCDYIHIYSIGIRRPVEEHFSLLKSVSIAIWSYFVLNLIDCGSVFACLCTKFTYVSRTAARSRFTKYLSTFSARIERHKNNIRTWSISIRFVHLFWVIRCKYLTKRALV